MLALWTKEQTALSSGVSEGPWGPAPHTSSPQGADLVPLLWSVSAGLPLGDYRGDLWLCLLLPQLGSLSIIYSSLRGRPARGAWLPLAPRPDSGGPAPPPLHWEGGQERDLGVHRGRGAVPCAQGTLLIWVQKSSQTQATLKPPCVPASLGVNEGPSWTHGLGAAPDLSQMPKLPGVMVELLPPCHPLPQLRSCSALPQGVHSLPS